MRSIQAKSLKSGMTVVNDFGQERTLTTDAMKTHQGYIKALTVNSVGYPKNGVIGEPVNVHGSNLVTVK